MIKITVLFFASLRELTGLQSTEIVLAEGEETMSCLLQKLGESYICLRDIIVDDQISIALNKQYLAKHDADHILHQNDEVALLPPISGG
mmetsp:Transcript_33584/g.48725  ORF Transcript_33584/g.48725 Transcript_33584/m.48725 type:complete len:89 (+) Transcript_33584:3-269(+)